LYLFGACNNVRLIELSNWTRKIFNLCDFQTDFAYRLINYDGIGIATKSNVSAEASIIAMRCLSGIETATGLRKKPAGEA